MTRPICIAVDSFAGRDDGNLVYVDMLRGLAILGVLLCHSTMGMGAVGLNSLPLHLEYLLMAGKHGVTLFFVVSAFTLMRSMHIKINEENMPIRKYFLRRFFRIAPAYYLILVIVFLFYGKGFPGYTNPQESILTWPDFFSHILFINSFFPFYANDFLGVEWSVSTEFMFYLLLPFFYMWLNNKDSRTHIVIRLALLYFGAVTLYWAIFFKGGYLQALGGGFSSPIFGAWSYFFIPTHLHAFIAGMAIWLFISLKDQDYPICRKRLIFALTVLFGIALAGAYVEALNSGDSRVVWIGLILWGMLSAAFIYVLHMLRPTNAIGVRILAGLGKVSFSLYLVHFPIYYGLSKLPDVWDITSLSEVNFMLYEIAGFGLAYILARLLFQFVEKPGMRLGQLLIGRVSKQ